MTSAGPLTWRTGRGWLVVGGGGRWERGETGAVDAAALAWADNDRPMAVLVSTGQSATFGEALLDYYADLGGAEGVVIPVLTAGDAYRPEYCRLLAQSGLVYLADGADPLGLARLLRDSPILEALGAAFEDGAAIVAQGNAAAALGAWVRPNEPSEGDERGLEWVVDVIIEPRYTTAAPAARLRQLLMAHPAYLGVGIPRRSGLALGPDGRVQSLGNEPITVVVGPRAAAGGDDARLSTPITD